MDQSAQQQQQMIGCDQPKPHLSAYPGDECIELSESSCSDDNDIKAKLTDMKGDMASSSCSDDEDDEQSCDEYSQQQQMYRQMHHQSQKMCKMPRSQAVCDSVDQQQQQQNQMFVSQQMSPEAAAMYQQQMMIQQQMNQQNNNGVNTPIGTSLQQQQDEQQQQQYKAAQQQRKVAKMAKRKQIAAQQEQQLKKESATAAAAVVEAASQYNDKRVTRKFRMQRTVSLNELAANPDMSKWCLDAAQTHLYQKEKKVANNGRTVVHRLGDPSKAVIERLAVTKVDSRLPVSIAVTATELPATMYTENGTPMLFSVESGESSDTQNIVYSSAEALSDKNMQKYGHLTRDHINKTFGAYPLDNKNYYWVHPLSPIVQVIGENKERFSAELQGCKMVDDKETAFLKLPKSTVEVVRDELFNMLDNLPHSNLHNFNLCMRRADGQRWNSSANIITFNNSDEQVRRALDDKRLLVIEFEMTYVLTTLEAMRAAGAKNQSSSSSSSNYYYDSATQSGNTSMANVDGNDDDAEALMAGARA